MLDKLLNWEEWDEVGPWGMQLYKATLKQDIGPFKAEEKFHLVYFDFEGGLLQFFKNEGDEDGPIVNLKLVEEK